MIIDLDEIPPKEEVENVRVFIRIRPLRESEKTLNNKRYIHLERNVLQLLKSNISRTFQFCKVFGEESTQVDLYRCIAVPIVEKVLKGYNGTIFAYGQSGTGKTHTMIGDIKNSDQKGIVPNIFSHIFAQISLANHDISYAVTVTYLEIYNEDIRDLLSDDPTKKLKVQEKPGVGVYVKDLLGFTVNSLETVDEILTKGNKNRSTGATKLNDSSSRSHAIFTVSIESKNKVTNKTTFGKLNLVDLAGSERVNKTQATGDRLREAGKINMSLSILGNVISALVDGKSSHIPYRNSKLTRLLQDSLGGNSLTAMVAMISPNILDYEESLYTLMYADRVKHIQNRVHINSEKQSLIDSLESKIGELRLQLADLTVAEQKEKKKERKKMNNSLELENIELEKSMLENKIYIIQKKILVGGENLIEKAQQQMEMLEDTARELEHLDSSHLLLEEILYYKGKEKTIVERKYATLQEEDKELDQRISESEKLMVKATEILVRKECEYQNEISSLLATNKALAKEMALVNFVVNNYVPKEFINKVKSGLLWDEDSQEWRVKGIAYCGNNMKRNEIKRKKDEIKNCDIVYFKYEHKKST
ncbi:unnamed protein product [Acanthoscelides obtectus]|uniref:Kinesin-like protein n=1 Tax=Acanthoscelides obtectus TaxID=200917 RepID=A0A9P0KIX3_ACAOB|nr:unnamed protein product [Acanthoscelides obtectus]CAK1635226.1 Kinesin-like protein KIF3A [Acanthoscelides obtectus]